MSQISLGEDILGVLLAVILISTFVIVLGNSYSRHKENEKEVEKTNNILYLSDLISYGTIKDNEYSSNPGIIQIEYLNGLKDSSELFYLYENRLRLKISSIEKNETLAEIV